MRQPFNQKLLLVLGWFGSIKFQPKGIRRRLKKIVGTVAASHPIFAHENITGEVLVEASVVGSGKCFALYTQGDSMIDAGINDGDLIIVRRQPIAEDGDIVIALLDDEATVKRLKIDNELIELVPENPRLKPIRVKPEDELRILGKVVGRKRI